MDNFTEKLALKFRVWLNSYFSNRFKNKNYHSEEKRKIEPLRFLDHNLSKVKKTHVGHSCSKNLKDGFCIKYTNKNLKK